LEIKKVWRGAAFAATAKRGAILPEIIPQRTNLESELVRIWEHVFQCAPLGIQEDFLDLGGTSSLMPNEAYALTVFILYKNKIIKETDIIDAKTLPVVKMPNLDGFIPSQLD
jgi:hypothetical protein